jgi:hypothetical protein
MATTTPPRTRGAATGPRGAARAPARGRGWTGSRVAFYAHLWLGVLFTVVLTVIAITGILLNHKRTLGLMPDVANEPAAPFASALPLARLAEVAVAALPPDTPDRPAELTPAHVDRMDVRPRDGYVKVRMRDRASTEVTVDLASGRVLHIGRRGDVFLERLHSGETFGDGWVLLSDAGAVALLVTLVSGYWLWLAPKLRRRAGPGRRAADHGDAEVGRE